MKRIAFAVVTVMLGACAGAFCWAFFFLMNAGLDLLWVKAPAWLAAIGMPAVVYPLAFCVVGGVAIGLFQKNVGPYPDDMNTVLAEVKKTGRYEYRHLGAMFVGALLPLLFGGSIGPEAGLTGVVAGLCSWVGDRLKFMGAEMRELANAARRPFCRRSSRPRCSAWRRRCSAMRTIPTGVGMGAARPLRPWFPRPRFPNRSKRRCTCSPWPGRWGRSCCSTRRLAAVRGCRTSPPWQWGHPNSPGHFPSSRSAPAPAGSFMASAGPWASCPRGSAIAS